LCARVILAPRNDIDNNINNDILKDVHGEMHTIMDAEQITS
jgi:hypothetical protein